MVLLEVGTVAPMQYPAPSTPQLETLSSKALLLYESMRQVARKVSDARGYCAAVSQVHFFVPGEIVADALGMARSTMYLKLEELKAADLIDARAHYVTHRGRTRADGMVWCVKMHPERRGAVRVPHDALKKSYRCLSDDVANRRTVYALLKSDSQKTSSKEVDIQKILAWAVAPPITKKLGTGLTVRCDLEQVLDLPYVGKADRRAAVDGAARALSSALNDAGGLMFWRWLCWRLISLEASGVPATGQVYEQARRVLAEHHREGYGRVPAALLVARLKRCPWWDAVMRGPPVRVGMAPVQS